MFHSLSGSARRGWRMNLKYVLHNVSSESEPLSPRASGPPLHSAVAPPARAPAGGRVLLPFPAKKYKLSSTNMDFLCH